MFKYFPQSASFMDIMFFLQIWIPMAHLGIIPISCLYYQFTAALENYLFPPKFSYVEVRFDSKKHERKLYLIMKIYFHKVII